MTAVLGIAAGALLWVLVLLVLNGRDARRFDRERREQNEAWARHMDEMEDDYDDQMRRRGYTP